MEKDAFEALMELAEPLLPGWDAIDVRVLGVPNGSNPAKAAFLYVHVIRSLDHNDDVLVPRVPGIECQREIFAPASEIRGVLNQLRRGTIKVNGHEFTMAIPDSQLQQPGRLTVLPVFENNRNATIVLRLESTSTSEPRLAVEDRILPCCDPPYANTSDMLTSFLGRSEDHYSGGTDLSIRLNVGVELVSLSVKKSRIQAIVAPMKKGEESALTASFMVETKEGRQHRWRENADQGEHGPGDSYTWKASLPPGATNGTIWMHYHGFLVGEERFVVMEGHPKGGPLNALATIAGEEKFLESSLPRNQKDNHRLEAFIAMIFHCLSWQSLGVGATHLEGCDVIAHAPSGRIAMVECTVSTPSQDNKVAKLHQRAQQMQQSTGVQVIPVLAINVEREHILKADLDAAEADGIVVLGERDLKELIQLVYQNPKEEAVINFLRGRVPGRPHVSWAPVYL